MLSAKQDEQSPRDLPTTVYTVNNAGIIHLRGLLRVGLHGGLVVKKKKKKPTCLCSDTGSIPDPGKTLHAMEQLELRALHLLSSCSKTREGHHNEKS